MNYSGEKRRRKWFIECTPVRSCEDHSRCKVVKIP
jgi:hypothetical protein